MEGFEALGGGEEYLVIQRLPQHAHHITSRLAEKQLEGGREANRIHSIPIPNLTFSFINSSSTYGEGTWVMGNPAASYAYPNPNPNPAHLNANYMSYSAHPPPPPSANQYPYAPPSDPPPPPQPTNPYVHASPVSGKRPVDALRDVVGRWGKKVEKGTKKAEGIAGNVWHHPQNSSDHAQHM
ncbi:hypothetical protein ACLOJK_022265 [Asimina triloba]